MMTFLNWGNQKGSMLKYYVTCANSTETGMWSLMVYMVIFPFLFVYHYKILLYEVYFLSICLTIYLSQWNAPGFVVPGIFLHDPVSFVALVRPDLFSFKKGVVRVETQGISVGHTLMDQGLKLYFQTVILFEFFFFNWSSFFKSQFICSNLMQVEYKQPLDRIFPYRSCLDSECGWGAQLHQKIVDETMRKYSPSRLLKMADTSLKRWSPLWSCHYFLDLWQLFGDKGPTIVSNHHFKLLRMCAKTFTCLMFNW